MGTRRAFFPLLLTSVWLAAVAALTPGLAIADQAPPPEKAAAEVLDLSYLPPDTIAAAVAFPRRSLAKPEAQELPLEVISIWSRKELGLDLTTVEQVVAGFRHDGKSKEHPPQPVLMLRVDKPLDRAQLLARLQLAGPPEQRSGQEVYVAPDDTRLSAMFPDERTLVLGPADAMPSRQDPAAQTGELFTRLRAAAGEDDVVGVFAVDPLRELIDEAVARRPAPPPLSMLLDARKHIVSVEVRASAIMPVRLQVALHAKSSSSATNLEGAVNMVLAFGRLALNAQMQQQQRPGEDPELDAAMQRYMQRMFDRTFDQLKPKREGNDVVMRLEGQGGVATTGVLVALLLPAVQAAREAARRIQSMNNLKQLALGMHVYHDAHNSFPPRANFDKQGRPLLSWRVHLLPYLEQEPLYKQFHLDEPWDSEHNKKLIPRMPVTFASPNRPNDGKTVYLVPVGPGTLFGGDQGMKLSEITDGTSNTIMLVEADADRAVEWTRPEGLGYDPEHPLAGVGNTRKGGFLAALADGSVRFISNNIDPEVLRAMFTAAGNETIDPE
ncbi:MAG: DUF1559 domain-containing protein [Pirellulales bacterium]